MFNPALGRLDFLPSFLFEPLAALTTHSSRAYQHIADFISRESAARLLEVGCGPGSLLSYLEQRSNCSLTGLDIDLRMLKLARRQVSHVSLLLGAAQQLPFSSNSYDNVVFVLTLHHLKLRELRVALSEAHRVLRKNATLIVLDWTMPSSALVFCGLRLALLIDGKDSTLPLSQGALPRLVRESGFQNCEVHETFSTLFGTLALYAAERI